MKDVIQSKPYFAAYSLTAMNEAAKKPAKSSNKQFLRVINRLRMPLSTAYMKRTSINRINIPTGIHSADKNWFIHYE